MKSLSAILACTLLLSGISYAGSFEKRVFKLYERYLNLQDQNLSWKCFANKLADILQEDERYYEHSVALRRNTQEGWTGALGIGLALQPYRDMIPETSKKLLNKHTDRQLLGILQARLKLNGKARCENKLGKEL